MHPATAAVICNSPHAPADGPVPPPHTHTGITKWIHGLKKEYMSLAVKSDEEVWESSEGGRRSRLDF